MATQRLFLLVLAGLSAVSASNMQAQAISDEDAIRHLIGDYIKCWRAADVECLAPLFALEEGRVMWVSEQAGEQVLNSMTFAEVLKRRQAQPEYGIHWEVLMLDVIDGELAVSKVMISRSGGRYIDFLIWQKIGAAWQIVNKTFVVQEE